MSGFGDRLRQVQADVKGVTPEALARAGEVVRRSSVEKTPILTGALRESAYVEVDAEAGTAQVIYDSVYAARQHYELSWKHPRGGQALFLTTAIEETRDEVMQILADDIGRALDGDAGGSAPPPDAHKRADGKHPDKERTYRRDSRGRFTK